MTEAQLKRAAEIQTQMKQLTGVLAIIEHSTLNGSLLQHIAWESLPENARSIAEEAFVSKVKEMVNSELARLKAEAEKL